MDVKKGSEVEIKIDSAAYKGKGVGRLNGMAVFVPDTAPGDRVKIRITKRKKNYLEGKLLEVTEPSDMRIEPKCQHASQCGGCNWQHIPYEKQLEFKQQQVRDHLHRIGGLSDLEPEDTIGCEEPFYYRNKMEYSIGHKRWLSRDEIESDEFVDDRCFAAGLHAPGRFDKILDLQECHLQNWISYQILNEVRSWCKKHEITPYNTFNNTGFMRNVVIRTSHHTDDLMVNLVTNYEDHETIQALSEHLLDQFKRISTIVNNVNDRPNPTAIGRYEQTIYGPGYIEDYIGPYKFQIDANAFFQTNTRQAETLYNVALEYADLQPDETLYDLYCGVGTLGIYLSSRAKKVVGIESEAVAIENARKNASTNDIENIDFVKGEMKDTLKTSFVEEYGKPDCLITDPPRAGMHKDVVAYINELNVPKFVYVSCNPSTMARDLNRLKSNYRVEKVQPVDMFPQTYHIEAVTRLRRRE